MAIIIKGKERNLGISLLLEETRPPTMTSAEATRWYEGTCRFSRMSSLSFVFEAAVLTLVRYIIIALQTSEILYPQVAWLAHLLPIALDLPAKKRSPLAEYRRVSLWVCPFLCKRLGAFQS